jgi:multiple antibiotic resistance protein
MEHFSYFLTALTTLFIIVDPLGNIPMFIAITERLDDEAREKVSKKSIAIGATLLLIMGLGGWAVMEFFRITLDGLKIAGGIMLFIVSIDILLGKRSREYLAQKSLESVDIDSLAVFPIALPLYTGPGAITAAIVLASEGGPVERMLLVLAILLVYGSVRLTHKYASNIIRLLGKSGSDIIARVMAIFLAAIAVEYVFDGLSGKFEKLMGLRGWK